MINNDIAINLQQNDDFSSFDVHFAKFIADFATSDKPLLYLTAALLSRATAMGNVCLDLSFWAEKQLLKNETVNDSILGPSLAEWNKILRGCPVIGQPGDVCPLILDEKNRLYLYRYWEYEQLLVKSLRKRVNCKSIAVDLDQLTAEIDQVFLGAETSKPDWQRIAVLTSVLQSVCIISGGPGTGKTSLIPKILAVLIKLFDFETNRIYLAAPTGKAAARLVDAIQTAKLNLHYNNSIISAMPAEAFTIHRMLQPIPGSTSFKYNAERLLPADVVIVDEASMVDLPLMSKLIQALPLNTKVILIGDKDQLASVEAGAILGDICACGKVQVFSKTYSRLLETITQKKMPKTIETETSSSGLQDCIVILQKNYRFPSESGIGHLSRLITEGNDSGLIDFLKSEPHEIKWHQENMNSFFQILAEKIMIGYSDYLAAKDPLVALEAFNRFRILCAVNFGPFGVKTINGFAEAILRDSGLIAFNPIVSGYENTDNYWYPGKPVMITANDYKLGLFNGDIGIVVNDLQLGNHESSVFFRGTDGNARRILPHQLPAHDTVFAMTVHKSQGSEFEEVMLLLPEMDYPVLTRELLYTAVTRARKKISIWGQANVLRSAVNRPVQRASGLRDALWNHPNITNKSGD